MKKNKRIIGILISLSVVFSTGSIAFAAENTTTFGKAMAYIKPDFTVQVNEKIYVFKDANGQRVYPLVYNGNTYLPVRAVSALMDEDIEWDNYSRTVFIGKTLSNPNKSKSKKSTENQGAAAEIEQNVSTGEKSSTVTVSIRNDIVIMYDFEIQKFTDESGNVIYPIIYEGSTYLPVRCVSALMEEPITWDNITKTVIIGGKEEESEENEEGEEGEDKEKTVEKEVSGPSPVTKGLVAQFEAAIEIYDQATEKIVRIKQTTDVEELNLIARAVSADVIEAQKQTLIIKNMKTGSFTEQELEAREALYQFSQMSEYYLLVLENIAYMAASEADYSVLAETFLNFALQSQEKMNSARKLIEAL